MSIKLFLLINYLFLISNDLIPHIIHFAWFSENPKTELVKNCIASWKKYSPGWLIVQWTRETLFPFDNDFIKEAYEFKKYAFIADFLRVYALYYYGGVYIDSDVELKSSLSPFLNHSFFISQSRDKWLHVAPDCYGARKGHPLLKKMLEYYRSNHFLKEDGHLDEKWVGIRFTRMIKKLYNISLEVKIKNPIILPNNGSIYPTFYFEQEIQGKPNIANHFCTGSWKGNKYNDEKYLANCYYSCRSSLKDKQFLKQNKKESKNISQNNFLKILILNLSILIIDIILKIYIIFRKKNSINKII